MTKKPFGKKVVARLTKAADDLEAGKPLKVRTLSLRRRKGTIAATSSKGAAAVAGRERIREPDPSTPEGQCALYLQHLLQSRGVTAPQLAAAVGKAKTTIFNYLAGETTPSDSVRDQLAKALGLRDYRDLMPTDEFLRRIGQRPRRRR